MQHVSLGSAQSLDTPYPRGRRRKSSGFSGIWVRELAVSYLRSEEIEEKKKDVMLTEHR